MLAVPLAIAIEQIDSVYALDVRGRKVARESGVLQYERAVAPGDSDKFPAALEKMLTEHRARLAALGL